MSEPKQSALKSTVAIVGTALRGPDAKKMTRVVFSRMMACANAIIERVWKLSKRDIVLVSGGAAGADHVAVCLFLGGSTFGGLQLYLPAPWVADSSNPQFDASNAEGKRSNILHGTFSDILGWESTSLQEIQASQQRGAELFAMSGGFHARNAAVAKASQNLIAFTWGADFKQPKDGGTRNTWDKCAGRKVHVPLDALMELPEKEAVESVVSKLLSSSTSARCIKHYFTSEKKD